MERFTSKLEIVKKFIITVIRIIFVQSDKNNLGEFDDLEDLFEILD